MPDKVFEEIKKILPGVQKNVLLSNHTSYKIGGPAKYFFEAKTKKDLISALEAVQKLKLPVFVLGGGSNVLISDRGFGGLAIKMEITDTEFKGQKVIVGAGVSMTKLSIESAKRGLSGLEWAAGIPGTIGGGIYGNAHAFGSEMADIVESAQAINTKTLKIQNFTKEQCKFSLKSSVFKSKKFIIVYAVLFFKKGDPLKSKKIINGFLESRKMKHPMNLPSAGSVFINSSNAPSWKLIKDCGLAGKKIGNAQISEKHANFIVNLGGASARDVLKLIKLAKQKVKKKFGISLETEIQLIGF